MHTASAQQTKNPLRPFDNSLLTSLPLLEVRADAPTFFVFSSIVPQLLGLVNNYLYLFLVILTHILLPTGHNKLTPAWAIIKEANLMDNKNTKNQNSNKNQNANQNKNQNSNKKSNQSSTEHSYR